MNDEPLNPEHLDPEAERYLSQLPPAPPDDTLQGVVSALQPLGITELKVQYSGYGDSGDIDYISIEPSDIVLPDKFDEVVKDVAWKTAYNLHSGFENNEGGQGHVTFDFNDRTVTVYHTDNVEFDEELNMPNLPLPEEFREYTGDDGSCYISFYMGSDGDVYFNDKTEGIDEDANNVGAISTLVFDNADLGENDSYSGAVRWQNGSDTCSIRGTKSWTATDEDNASVNTYTFDEILANEQLGT
jgi:hypothetical protein